MTTIVIWILVATGYADKYLTVVDRFATEADCLMVAQQLAKTDVKCIRAKVISKFSGQ